MVPQEELEQKFNTFMFFFQNKGGKTVENDAECKKETHGQDAEQKNSVFASLNSSELDPSQDMGSLKREAGQLKLQKKKIQGYQYSMSGHCKQVVEEYLELS